MFVEGVRVPRNQNSGFNRMPLSKDLGQGVAIGDDPFIQRGEEAFQHAAIEGAHSLGLEKFPKLLHRDSTAMMVDGCRLDRIGRRTKAE